MGVAIGIDLGTTNTVVAVVRDGRAITLEDDQGMRLIPSVVSFHPNGNVLVGQAAKERRYNDASNTIYSVKRLIGRPWKSTEVQESLTRFPFDLREGPKDTTMVVARNEQYALPEISAFVLRRAKQIAEARLGEQVDKAVITVPANFNDLQRAATKVAGKLAGLDVLRILNEPTAAALAYGQSIAQSERIAIYDLGGGTFDITLLDLSGSVFEVLATAGDTALGGDDIDVLIADRMSAQVREIHRFDPRAHPESFGRLRLYAEQIKIQLSTETEASMNLADIGYGEGGAALSMRFRMNRTELEHVCKPLLDKTIEVTRFAIETIGQKKEAFDRVILVGGQTRMPLVARKAEEYFGKAPFVRVNPDEVVALGAAIQAFSLDKTARKPAYVPPPARAAESTISKTFTQTNTQITSTQATKTDVTSTQPSSASPRSSSPTIREKHPVPDLPPGAITQPGFSPISSASAPKSQEKAQAKGPEKGQEKAADKPVEKSADKAKEKPKEKEADANQSFETFANLPRGLGKPAEAPTGQAPPAKAPAPVMSVKAREVEPEDPSLSFKVQEPPDLRTDPNIDGKDLRDVKAPKPPPVPPKAPAKAPGPPPQPASKPEPPSFKDLPREEKSITFTMPIPVPQAPERPPAQPNTEIVPDPASATEAAQPWAPSFPEAPVMDAEEAAQAQHATAQLTRAPLLIDVTPLSLSVETVGGYCDVLIPANSPVPCDRTRIFLTAADNQTIVCVNVAQGDSRHFAENTFLGQCELPGLTPKPRGDVKIAVTFEIDADGIVNVRAKDIATGRETQAKMRLLGGSTQGDVAAMLARQAQHEVH